jgi:hypothetical protein
MNACAPGMPSTMCLTLRDLGAYTTRLMRVQGPVIA